MKRCSWEEQHYLNPSKCFAIHPYHWQFNTVGRNCEGKSNLPPFDVVSWYSSELLMPQDGREKKRSSITSQGVCLFVVCRISYSHIFLFTRLASNNC